MKTEHNPNPRRKSGARQAPHSRAGFGQGACRPAGFTLLELLVVVAIIALLVAILIPTLRQARDQSRRAACLANVHQIAIAYQNYLTANNGRFMQWVRANANYGGIQGLDPLYQVAKPLNKYLGFPARTNDAKVFRCPSDTGSTQARQPTCYEAVGTSYLISEMFAVDRLQTLPFDPCNQPPRSLKKEINKRIQATVMDPFLNPKAPPPGSWGPKGLKRDQVTTDPSRLLLLGDHDWLNTWDFQIVEVADWHGRRHSYSMAFMDGHAEFLALRKGMHVTPKYTVIPFKDLLPLASTPPCGQEVPLPWEP